LREAARRKGKAITAARLAQAAWTILVTNVPPELLDLREALVLARAGKSNSCRTYADGAL
jgi:tryptophan 2,3-dioxygenase